jgi:hypothetical protein
MRRASRGRPRTEKSAVAPVFIRGRKFTFDFAAASHDRRPGIPLGYPLERAKMPVRELRSRKNHILVLNDEIEAQSAIESMAKSGRVMKDYLVGLMASVMHRGGEAR